jgi:Uncharacterised protein family (UPF0175)
MNVTVRIPDELAARLEAEGGDLERRALEALVLEEFRAGRMTKPELCAALGFEVLDEFDGFLKAHAVYEPYTLADFEEEQRVARELGL